MSFKKTLVAVAAGAALLTGVTNSSANSLLFPYFTTANGAQSALAIYGNNTLAATGETLHYVYNYGDSCTHFDGNGTITPNDVLQHSVAAPAAGGFGKAVGSDTSTPFYFPLANSYGFLVVTNTTTPGVRDISGDMAIVDPNTGIVTSYAGITNNSAIEGNFSGNTDRTFNLGFYGSGIVDTSWYGVVVGNMNGAITGNRNWTATATISNNGIVYDNDEKGVSGGMTKTLTCAGKIVATDLMNSAQAAVVGANGGLIHATATAGTGATGLVMTKIQTVKAVVGAPFAGKTFLHREQGSAF